MSQTSSGVLVSVNVGQSVEAAWSGSLGRTAIDKRPVRGFVSVRNHHVGSDVQVDGRYHGGPDQAIYAYAEEDARWWEATLSKPVRPGQFGENFTTRGLDLGQACIGERWRVGTALVEISAPRIPCHTFAGFWQMPDLVKRFTEAQRPGAYLRIIQEGEVAEGTSIQVVQRPQHGVTVREVFRARLGERELVPRMLLAPQLSKVLREWAERVAKE